MLDGVDLRVEAGEVVGVLGENGAGKTTLLKVIATILRPTSGMVRVFGLEAGSHEREVRTQCAYTFGDDRSFYWRLTGRQNLEFFAALQDIYGHQKDRAIAEVAERLDITSYLGQPFRFYSAGIRQRFAMARALLGEPRLLLLDEPTRSVDHAEARRIWSLVRDEFVAEGGSAILVTHSIEEAIATCDRVAVLRDGRIVSDVPVQELERDEAQADAPPTIAAGLRAS